jgi:hypothetical protein
MLREPNKGVYKGLQRNTDFISIISNRCARSYCALNLKIVSSDRLFIGITNLQSDFVVELVTMKKTYTRCSKKQTVQR